MRQYDLLDILNILSFVIGLLNYDENLTQGDKQDLIDKLEKSSSTILEHINSHLEEQDKLLKEILNDKNKKIS